MAATASTERFSLSVYPEVILTYFVPLETLGCPLELKKKCFEFESVKT